ncbi:MAG: hypothetical protein V1839_03420 [archaeon]
MAFLGGTLDVALGILIALVLLRYSGHLDEKVKKATALIAGGALFYIIDVAWNTGNFATKISAVVVNWMTFIFELVAFILIIIGAIWAVAGMAASKR